MKGDFSNLAFRPRKNFTGVLHQQGRVLLDQDWNAATAIERHLRQRMGEDTIGPDVVAVPAAEPDGLKVLGATSDGSTVEIELQPGRGWIDGLHFYLPGPAPVTRTADYLETPAGPELRDAVILEVWEEAFSAFQDPLALIEPALGGPDTTERVKLAHALRLLRLDPGQDCGNLDLEDDFAAKGRLTVTPAPATLISGDCPVEAGGGYTGFEHYLYRIEVAEPGSAGHARIKWSRYNGGLVGRGTYNSATQEVTIIANDQMIRQCGLSDFYFEALALDADRGHWRTTLTARASLVDDTLALTNTNGSWPGAAAEPAFFRLWDGIRRVSHFVPGPTELVSGLGILLELDPPLPGNANYTPGDYWTFPARAAGVDFDPSTWPSNAPPQGIHYHRAPLAIVTWDAEPTAGAANSTEIHDCRHIFRPLTRLAGCCSYTVGDGLASHGDFQSIQTAIDALPPEGGEVCVLPGVYEENAVIANRACVRIVGCGKRSRVVSGPADPVSGQADPVFHVRDSREVRLESLAIVADETGIGVLVEEGTSTPPPEPVRDIQLVDLEVQAATRSAIEVAGGEGIVIRGSRVEMLDVASRRPAVTIEAEDVLIEDNELVVAPAGAAVGGLVPQGSVALGVGGLWLRGGCERVRVIDNLIRGGVGNGITLGHIELEAGGKVVPQWGVISHLTVDPNHPCWPCGPGTGWIPGGNGTPQSPIPIAGPPLEEIRIEDNRILEMGLNGIAVIGFFDSLDEVISVADLAIRRNQIQDCLGRGLQDIPQAMIDRMGFGGVVLADVETLLVTGNRIEDNGHDHLEPVCGVYVMHGEGVDISDNRILNNGAKTDQHYLNSRPGARGGIFIHSAEAPVFDLDATGRLFPNVRGVPAVKVHDNVVSAPLGRALTITALGPVSVTGNQLSSHGVTILDVLAPTVRILNLGLPAEFAIFGGLLSFTGLYDSSGQLAAGGAAVALEVLRRNPFNGNVLFTDNQCLLELLEPGFELAIASVVVLSLDDVAVENNQCDCEMLLDAVLTNALVVAPTVRVTGNRFREGLLIAFLSAMTLGIFNLTTHNEGTHCIIASWALPGDGRREPNLEIVDHFLSFSGELSSTRLGCSKWRKILQWGQERD